MTTPDTTPSVLETIYKPDLVDPIYQLQEALEKGLVADEITDPLPLLDSFSKALFDSSRPIGQAIGGDAYLIEQLPASVGPDGQKIAAMLFASDFFATPDGQKIVNNPKQSQGLVELLNSTLTLMESEQQFGDVKQIRANIQEHMDSARRGGMLHLANKDQVLAKIPHKPA